ncbi:hypothetical protein [Bacillus cereus]
MKLKIIDGKYYLAEYDRAYGWYGYEITHEAYDALRDCDIDDKEEDLNDRMGDN